MFLRAWALHELGREEEARAEFARGEELLQQWAPHELIDLQFRDGAARALAN